MSLMEGLLRLCLSPLACHSDPILRTLFDQHHQPTRASLTTQPKEAHSALSEQEKAPPASEFQASGQQEDAKSLFSLLQSLLPRPVPVGKCTGMIKAHQRSIKTHGQEATVQRKRRSGNTVVITVVTTILLAFITTAITAIIITATVEASTKARENPSPIAINLHPIPLQHLRHKTRVARLGYSIPFDKKMKTKYLPRKLTIGEDGRMYFLLERSSSNDTPGPTGVPSASRRSSRRQSITIHPHKNLKILLDSNLTITPYR